MTFGGMKRAWSQNQGGRGADSDFNRPRFSGYFGPSDSPPDEDQVVELGLLIRLHWVGLLIGKKGATIRELNKKSEAKMNFGDDDIEVDQEKFHVMAISGTREQVKKASIAVADKLAELTQSEDWKLIFLIPDSYCGMFIGKKGANVKKMKGEAGNNLWIKLSQEPLKLPGVSEVTTCTIFGPKDSVKTAIEVAAQTLGDISASMQQAMKAEQAGFQSSQTTKLQESKWMPPSYGGGFGRTQGAPPSYGGGFRDIESRSAGGYRGGFGGGNNGFGAARPGEAGGYGKGSGGRGYRPGGGYGSGFASGGTTVGRGSWNTGASTRGRGGWAGARS